MLSTKLKATAGNSADATLYVDDVFSTYLYTGNGSTQTITNGIDLAGKGGMVWAKSRSAATDHKLTDTVRGATKALISDTTGAETTDTTGLTAFNSTGFSLGASSVYNTNAATYASWTFRKAAKFFDVVTWTGDGTDKTINHNLGVAPGMICIKKTNATGNWWTYHRSLGLGPTYPNFLYLNTTGSLNSGGGGFFSGVPTSSQFFVGPDINTSGDTFVAYLFAHDTSSTGIIQCGSFTTAGQVNLGWEPQYLLYKKANGTSNWIVYDSMRGFGADTSNPLYPNLSVAEGTGDTVTANATGFNSPFSGSTFIYMAIRRPNKPPTTGTQVFESVARTTTNPNLFTTALSYVDLAINRRRTASPSTPLVTARMTGVSGLVTSSTASEITTQASYAYNYQVNPDYYDAIGGTEIDWLFKRAPGFFDEVCYTGTGSATTQAHNLGVVPELMIVKERSAVNNWWVYDAIDGNTKYSVLNSTAIPAASSTAWNNTTPTASVFSIGTATNVNASTQTFVAYLFATLAGISKVGSYTGNGSTGQAIACGFSAGARFVLIKRTDSTGDWYTFDSARGLTSGSSPYLLLNSTAAEVTGNNGVYASTGGFTLGSTASTTTNINAATYIFLAVA